MTSGVRLFGACAAACLIAACTSGTSGTSGTSRSAPTTSTTAGPAPSSSPAPSMSSGPSASTASGGPGASPDSAHLRFRHVIIVIMENHSYAEVLQSANAPYLRHLARAGTDYTAFHAETHPSQPNYLALFSGGTQGVTDDSCPHSFAADNIAHQLLSRGFTFAAYSEGLPSAGWLGCSRGSYARRHAPWTNFADVPRVLQLPMTSFPRDLNALPDVSFVVPDLDHDMHDGSVAAGDAWVSAHLSNYARWAATHQSLLVVTFDEDDRSEQNLIPTFAVGQGVPARLDAAPLNHYSLLAALEDLFALPRIGHARGATPMRLS